MTNEALIRELNASLRPYKITGRNDENYNFNRGISAAIDIVKNHFPSEIPVEKREAYDGDWLNDTTHENGNYANKCTLCGEIFNGHKRRVICKWCSDRQPKREMVAPEIDKGLPMSAIRSGMRLKGTTMCDNFPICTVTEITEKGFKYIHDRWYWRPEQWSEGGECYGQGGYSYYKEIEGGQS